MKKIFVSLLFCACFKNVGSSVHKMAVEPMLTADNVMYAIKKSGIAFPDIVFAQARLETGNFTSRILIENKNLFGMKLPKSRPTNALGEKNNHANYRSWVHSVRDYKLWQDAVVAKYKTRRAYLNYLAKNYAEDKKYIHKLKQML